MCAMHLLETDNLANDWAMLGDVVDKAVVRIINIGATTLTTGSADHNRLLAGRYPNPKERARGKEILFAQVPLC